MRFAGALILNKIIDDLKSKLPFLKKKEEEIDAQSEDKTGLTEITDLNSVEDDSLEESESEDKSLLNKLKAKISSLQKKKKKPSSEEEDEDSEDDDEDSEENEEEEKKKKRSKIIRIAIVGALVVFLVSDYIFPPEDAPTEGTPEVVESPARRNKKKVEEAPTEAPAEEPTTPEETATPSEVTQTEPTDSTPVESTIPEPVETTPSETVETPTEETPSGIEQLPDVSGEGSTESPTTTYTPDDSPVDITSDDNSIDTAPSESSSNDSIFGEDSSLGDLSTSDTDGGTGAGADDFTDQILQDLEKQANPVEEKKTVTKYIAPPDYEFQGRGLVYNCRGKHWACVDAPSYKTCEDNSISTKQFGKPTECYPFNVYETTRGCEITQNRMVSSNAKTKFCEE